MPDLVYVDFLAGDERGMPIPDLRKDEVTFRMDGKPRQIRSLQFIPFGEAPLGDRIARRPLPPPFGTNILAQSGRLIMIVVEHESIRPGKERPAMQGLERMLSRLSDSDRVGLATMPHGRVEVEPTTDHEAVADVLRRLKGQAPQLQGELSQAAIDSEKACNSRLTLTTLTGLLEALSVVEGPKSIVFVSSGVMPPRRDALMTQAPGRCEIRSVYFDSVADAASLARAHFYVVQPDDLNADAARQAFDNPTASRFSSADDEFAGLQHLTGVTGGEIFRLNGPADAVFAHIARESSGYYMVGFEPLLEERDGMSHRVEIKVARPRASVRSRPHLTLAKGPSSTTPQQMLRDPRIYHDLPLRAVAYPARMLDDARLKIVGVAEPLDPGVPVTAMSMAVLDAKGRISSQWTATAEELKGAPDAARRNPHIMSALVAPAGNYRLRVAAVDANGRRGSVDYEFDAVFENAGTLKVSALALGTGPLDAFTPRMLFIDEPSATAFLELYGDPAKAAGVSVRLEIASDRDDPAIVSAPAPTQPATESDRRMAAGTLPLGSLEPGDYIVRAIITSDGR
ncbi:MAG TPA: VWA domain-containing protein, partial [Vicinamibacterales bacterium]